jgi:hypothetical protein
VSLSHREVGGPYRSPSKPPWACEAIDTGEHGIADTMTHAVEYAGTPSISRTDGHGR